MSDKMPESALADSGNNLCAHCVSGVVHSGTPTGTEIKLGSIPCYYAAPPIGHPAAPTIIFFTDIFGYSFINARLLADSFASKNLHVLIPDIFDGDAVDPSLLGFMDVETKGWVRALTTTDDLDNTLTRQTFGPRLPPPRSWVAFGPACKLFPFYHHSYRGCYAMAMQKHFPSSKRCSRKGAHGLLQRATDAWELWATVSEVAILFSLLEALKSESMLMSLCTLLLCLCRGTLSKCDNRDFSYWLSLTLDFQVNTFRDILPER